MNLMVRLSKLKLEDLQIDAQSVIKSEFFDIETNGVDKIYYNQAKDFKWHSAVQ